jgi:hypothetical protein
LSRAGFPVRDRINLLYSDISGGLQDRIGTISHYADALREIAYAALDEEAVLIAVYVVYHAE